MRNIRPLFIVSLLAVLPVCSGAADMAGTQRERPFLKTTGAAMDRMMKAMMVDPTGDVDADFARMMIPHHQGAIDMAAAELRYGKNERLRRIAHGIVVEQQQEIAAMRRILAEIRPSSGKMPAKP